MKLVVFVALLPSQRLGGFLREGKNDDSSGDCRTAILSYCPASARSCDCTVRRRQLDCPQICRLISPFCETEARRDVTTLHHIILPFLRCRCSRSRNIEICSSHRTQRKRCRGLPHGHQDMQSIGTEVYLFVPYCYRQEGT